MDAKELKKILNLLKGAGRIQLTGGYTVDTLVDDWMDGYKYASQQMPSEEEITKEAVRINDGNLDRYKKGMHYNSDWKTGAMWLKSLQQENQTED